MRQIMLNFVSAFLLVLTSFEQPESALAFSPASSRTPPLSSHLLWNIPSRTTQSTNLCSSLSANSQNDSSSSSSDDDNNNNGLRDRLRQVTGFSLTALRTTMRTATGISLTAIWLSAVAFTSAAVRRTLAFFVGIFPTWFRYFLQPFLVLYYVPLLAIRGMSSRQENLKAHEAFVEHIKQAVKAADEAQHGGYWPVHINEEGMIETDPNEGAVDMNEALVESVEVALEEEEKKHG